MGTNCYLQISVEECKYVEKENKMTKFINAELEIFSDESAEEGFDEE